MSMTSSGRVAAGVGGPNWPGFFFVPLKGIEDLASATAGAEYMLATIAAGLGEKNLARD